ncbi:MAG: pyridoxamine 5'-phosphate oxidase family protein [Roseobacter sp.]
MTSPAPKPVRDVWHVGEKRMHNALGVADRMRDRGSIVIRDYMPDQHRTFFADQKLVMLSALDTAGHPWPFLRTGPQGFMTSPSPDVLCVTSQATAFEQSDLQMVPGSKISVLGIEFETKRRNRLNGTISRVDGDTLWIAVDQSFGNCPRYIHVRDHLRWVGREPKLSSGSDLSSQDVAQIKAADACFIASRAAKIGIDRRAGVDVNHRGGHPGFVHVTKDRHLIIPDYDGNKFFNTIGNILLDSRVSLMFVDFDTGDVMTLAGDAEVELDTGAKSAIYGAERVIQFIPKHVLRAQSALPFACDLRELSRDPPV